MDFPSLSLAPFGLEAPSAHTWPEADSSAGETSPDPAAWFRGTADAGPLRLPPTGAGSGDVASLARQVLAHLLA
jgi:hypothetical protein